jgi:branched-chain amino acid transport system substrate-binding protein
LTTTVGCGLVSDTLTDGSVRVSEFGIMPPLELVMTHRTSLHPRLAKPSLRLLTVGVAGLALALSSCGSSSGGGGGSNSGDIVLGDISVVSGEAAQYGEQIRAGEDLAVKQINDTGGINGRKLRIEHKDNHANKAEAVALFRGFVGDKKIQAVLGPNTSTDAVATTDIANQSKIVSVVTGGAAPWPVPFGDWVFRVPAQNGDVIGSLVKDANASLHIRSAAIVYASDQDYSVAAEDLFKKVAAENNIKIARVEKFRAGDVDYSSLITALKNAHVDAVFISAVADNAGPMLRQAKELGLTGITWIGDAGLQNPAFWGLSNGAAAGALTGTPFDPTSTDPAVKSFVDAFKAANSADPTLYNAYGYDSVKLLAEAIKNAGENVSRQSIRDELSKISGLDAATGTLSFPDGSGNATRESIFIVEMQDGKFVSWQP